ncbi:MAG: hypothetical protein L0215_24685 [Gemmataceae bacterium]|nr:hypothetical protein [Gemmataceae bacterium]
MSQAPTNTSTGGARGGRKPSKPPTDERNAWSTTAGPSFTGLVQTLLDITARYPFLNAVWFVVVVAIALAMSRLLGVDDRTTFVAVVVAVLLFVVIVIYRVVTGLAKAKLTPHAMVIAWGAVILVLAFVLLLMLSVFFGWPLGLQSWIAGEAVAHWEYFTPNSPDALKVPYYKKTMLRGKDGGRLECKIVEETENAHAPWGVFIRFTGAEKTIQAVLSIPNHNAITVEFTPGKKTFELRGLRLEGA